MWDIKLILRHTDSHQCGSHQRDGVGAIEGKYLLTRDVLTAGGSRVTVMHTQNLRGPVNERHPSESDF